MTWHDMTWREMIWYMIRYMILYVMIWYDMIYDIWYDMIWYYIVLYYICYDMIYLLTAISLTPGVSSTVHIYTQTVHRTTHLTTNLGLSTKWDIYNNFQGTISIQIWYSDVIWRPSIELHLVGSRQTAF